MRKMLEYRTAKVTWLQDGLGFIKVEHTLASSKPESKASDANKARFWRAGMKFKTNFVSKHSTDTVDFKEKFLMFNLPSPSSARISVDASCQVPILAVVGY